jgi:hypothetical protein
MVYYKPRRRWGKYVAGLIGLLLIGAGIAVYYVYFREVDSGPAPAVIRPVGPGQVKAADIEDSGNQEQEANARTLFRAVQEYRTLNKGQFPTQYKDYKLSGGEGTTIVNFKPERFISVAFLQGAQRTMEVEALNVVTGAACSPKKDGSTVAAPSGTGRGYVIQYIQRGEDALITKCLEQ